MSFEGKHLKRCWFDNCWFKIDKEIGWNNFWKTIEDCIDRKRVKIVLMRPGWEKPININYLAREKDGSYIFKASIS